MSCSLCLTIQSQKRDSKAYHKTEPFFAELRIAFTGNDRPNLNCLFVCLFVFEFSLRMSCSLCLTIQSQKRDSKAYHKTEPFFAELRIAFTGNDRPNLNCLFVCLFVLEFSLRMSCFLCLTIQSQNRDSKAYHKTEPFFAELEMAFTGNDGTNLNCLFVPEFSLRMSSSLCLTVPSQKCDSKAYHKQILSLQSWE